jgi:hypothetical protein
VATVAPCTLSRLLGGPTVRRNYRCTVLSRPVRAFGVCGRQIPLHRTWLATAHLSQSASLTATNYRCTVLSNLPVIRVRAVSLARVEIRLCFCQLPMHRVACRRDVDLARLSPSHVQLPMHRTICINYRCTVLCAWRRRWLIEPRKISLLPMHRTDAFQLPMHRTDAFQLPMHRSRAH